MSNGTSARRVLLVAVAVGTCWASRAVAWPAETHVSILLAALRLSPAAESRLPERNREEFLRALQQGIELDVDCRLHRGYKVRHEAVQEAAKAFAELTTPGGVTRYSRPAALGRYLHFVQDAAVPNALASGEALEIRDLYANKNFILFRDATNLSGSFADALRRESADAQWGDDSETGQVPIVRLAINLTIDAVLLLPPVAGAPPVETRVPVIFLVNRASAGLAGRNDAWIYRPNNQSYVDPGTQTKDMLQAEAVQVIEWQRENVAGSPNVRILLYNNMDTCASSISVKLPRLSFLLPGLEIPPRGVRKIATTVPSGALGDGAFTASKVGTCTWNKNDGGSIPTDYRLVIDMDGKAPRFDGRAEQFVPTPVPSRRRATVR